MGRVVEVARRVGPEQIGLFAVVVAFLAASASFAVQMPAFYGADEHAHLGYAHAVAGGRLPEISDFPNVPPDAVEWRERQWESRDREHRSIWVANHPPLFYALVAPLVWLSDELGRSDGGLLFLRLANAALAAAGVLFTYLLAMSVTGGVRRVALAAAALVAFLPLGHAWFGHAMIDGLGFAASTAVTWAGVRTITGGFRRADLAVLGATAAVAAGARAATMFVAVLVVALVAVARIRNTPGEPLVKVRRGAVVGVAGLGPAALLFGWFYVRNVVLYGDVTGSAYLFDYFRRGARGSTLEMVTEGTMWANIFRRFVASPVPLAVPDLSATVAASIGVIFAVAGLAVVFATTRSSRQQRSRARRDGAGWPVSRSGIVVSVAVLGLVVAMLATHAAGGGSSFARYLFPALGAIGTLAAIGLHRLHARLLPVLAAATLCLWAAHFLPSRVATDIVTVGVTAATAAAPIGTAAELALLAIGAIAAFVALAVMIRRPRVPALPVAQGGSSVVRARDS